MKFDFREKLSEAAATIEIALGVLILVACVICSVGLIYTTAPGALFESPSYLRDRMSDACLIIIGVELIEMITSHSIDSVVDVMLLAVARQMIIEHTGPLENLLTVCAVGLLFVIRKYLYVSRLDKKHTSEKEKTDRK